MHFCFVLDVEHKTQKKNIYVERVGTLKHSDSVVCLQNMGAQAALQAAQSLAGSMDEPKTVLRVIIEHMLYPVTIDILKQVTNPSCCVHG